MLYKCSALAGGCSSCLSISSTLMLDCGWCNNLTSCVIMESCPDDNTFTTTSSTCPLPQIIMVCKLGTYSLQCEVESINIR